MYQGQHTQILSIIATTSSYTASRNPPRQTLSSHHSRNLLQATSKPHILDTQVPRRELIKHAPFRSTPLRATLGDPPALKVLPRPLGHAQPRRRHGRVPV